MNFLKKNCLGAVPSFWHFRVEVILWSLCCRNVPSVLSLVAVKHLVEGTVTVMDHQPDITVTVRLLILSLRFNGHLPGEPGLAGVYWSKGWWRRWWQLDYWSYKLCKAPVKSSPTNRHPVFYRLDTLPVAQPTVSKHWRENITFHGLADPKLTWGLPTLSLTTITHHCQVVIKLIKQLWCVFFSCYVMVDGFRWNFWCL